ncbi:IS200/IS605 family transposase [Danxiaibacter flavus]|uniref:IS200/IS605 family transposase n=1 Tax=Danxiaibacter flavus TaxID=3049108 RepID=A0ABV3ZMT7_9BACT|nr:IS200/IS605 family transposase [Chitinophagaceae bacterium DXS]
MSQSLSKVYIHLTFSTKKRAPIIDDNIKDSLWEYVGGICKGIGCDPVQVGGYTDHVHILCALSKKITVSQMIEDIKKQSSKWIKTKDPKYKDFYWQNGYGAFSVNPSEIEIVTTYIKNQEQHHKVYRYQEELIAFLKKYHIEYDERYLWD